MRTRIKIFIGFSITLTMIIGGFVFWALDVNPIMPEASNAMISDENIIVTDDENIIFLPKNHKYSTGFVFYPGGRVDPKSYAPLARAIASRGYLVSIAKMPLNLAMFGINRVELIMNEHPEISNWAIGGHSLGGVFATDYVFNHPNVIKGLILLAAYPTASSNLTSFEIDVLSIWGSLDTVLSENIGPEMNLLPPSAQYLKIEGGNHAQFGYYGEQNGDSPATISREMQQLITVDAIDNVLQKLG